MFPLQGVRGIMAGWIGQAVVCVRGYQHGDRDSAREVDESRLEVGCTGATHRAALIGFVAGHIV